MEFEKPFRISLKLKEGKSPHLYVTQIQELMKDDTSLHPMMKNTLNMLKKLRMNHIMLSTLREVVFDPQNLRHFDRSAKPVGQWTCTLWSPDEIKSHKADPEGHLRAAMKMFDILGYEMFNSQIVTTDYIQSLEEITMKQIENQNKQREKEQQDWENAQ